MEIAFTGFGPDHLIRGMLALEHPRLTDQLAHADELLVRDAVLEGLADLSVVAVGDHRIRRDELLAAIGEGPRGRRGPRTTTTRRRVQASVGPYQVLGRIHLRREGGIAERLRESGPLIPFTEATVAYVIGGVLEVHDAPVIHVNRDLAAWVRADPLARPFPGILAVPAWRAGGSLSPG